MNSDDYEPWIPIAGIPKRLYLEAMHDDYEGFRILLRGDDPSSQVLRIAFDFVIAYRNINESYRLKTWRETAGVKNLPPLRRVRHSTWIQWLVQEAGGVLDAQGMTHYAIYTAEDCVDVAASVDPDISWL